MKKHLRYMGLIAGLLLLPGCGLLNTTYEQPKLDMPAGWTQIASTADTPVTSAPAATTGSSIADHWWENFNDPALDALVEKALARNNDLTAAGWRLRQAQLQADLAENDLFPVLGGSGDASVTRQFSGMKNTSHSYSIAGNLNYELDLWGRISTLRDAADWEAKATEEDRQATALTLIGSVMTLYWQTGYLNWRIELGEQSIAYAQTTLDLVKVQYGAGASSSLELNQAMQNLAAQQASQTQLIQQRQETYTALAILFDGPPEIIEADPQTIPEGPLPIVEAGLPAQLLERRPDVSAAELRLRETLSNSDATKLSFFPTISLTGSLGSSSIALTDVMKNPFGTLGAGIVLPFLEINKMQLEIKVSKAQYQEAVVNYRQTLYAALKDVEDALSARTQFAAQGALLQAALDAARNAERINELRYRTGAVTLKDWLDAQEIRRQAEIALAENRFNRLANHVTLYQALGGDTAPLKLAAVK